MGRNLVKVGLMMLMAAVLAVGMMLPKGAVCLAGSVPEDLLSFDGAAVYFGEIKAVEGETVTVMQKKNVKGEFEADSEHTYDSYAFVQSPEVGKTYLCGYYDQYNPLFIWEVSGTDPATLRVLDHTGGGMEQRMQEYLNAGDFEKAEADRLERLSAAVDAPDGGNNVLDGGDAGSDNDTADRGDSVPGATGGADGPAGVSVTGSFSWALVWWIVAFAVLIIVAVRFLRK